MRLPGCMHQVASAWAKSLEGSQADPLSKCDEARVSCVSLSSLLSGPHTAHDIQSNENNSNL